MKPATQEGILRGNFHLDYVREGVELCCHISKSQDYIRVYERCKDPIIVAMHGYCFGQAIEISTAVGIRLAADIRTLNQFSKVGRTKAGLRMCL